MLFSFSKEFIPFQRVDGFGLLLDCRLFHVFTDERKIGQYFGHKDVSFYAYGDSDVRIDHEGYDRKVPRTRFIDQKTGAVIGRYQRRTTDMVSKGETFAKLWLGEEMYAACELEAEGSDRRRIRVYGTAEKVEFSFGWDRRKWTAVGQPILDGRGFLSSDNLALLFGGICLLEEFTDLLSFRVRIGD